VNERDSTSSQPAWLFNNSIAELRCGAFAGSLDVARPHMGVHQASFDQGSKPCLFLGAQRQPEVNEAKADDEERDRIWWPLPVAECYVRDNDLVATYSPVDSWPYSPQVYWSAGVLNQVDGVQGSLSLLVSVQTHLLETHPKIVVISQVPGAEMLLITVNKDGTAEVDPADRERTFAPPGEMCAVLWRLAHAPFSYVEIATANDIREIATGRTWAGPVAHWGLFAEFLEKGVIRRARVHAVLLPRENDVELALECCRALEQIPLPLTT
jgi:hypothetical protein